MTTPIAISGRPQASEYDSYWDRYISLISGEDILAVLEQQRRDTLLLLSGRTEEDGERRYANRRGCVAALRTRSRQPCAPSPMSLPVMSCITGGSWKQSTSRQHHSKPHDGGA